MPINVFVAENHTLVRQGIISLLENECEVNVVGSAADGFECLSEVNKIKPNVVLIDINISGINGAKIIKLMKEHCFNVGTIIISDNDNAKKMSYIIREGCDGFISKDCDVEILKRAVYSVYEGKKYIQPELEKSFNINVTKEDDPEERIKNLTKREIEVLLLISKGYVNKDISNELKITERTVKNHVSSIFRKINVNDRTQAAVFAVKNSELFQNDGFM